MVGDLEVEKFVFCGWKMEQEEDGSIKVDIEYAIKAISDKQVDMEDLKGMKKVCRRNSEALWGLSTG